VEASPDLGRQLDEPMSVRIVSMPSTVASVMAAAGLGVEESVS
jgi:hypothetical protein